MTKKKNGDYKSKTNELEHKNITMTKKENEDYKNKINELENKNITMTKKENDYYKNKINELENKITNLINKIENKTKNLELIIKEKDNKINELENKIMELKNKSNNNNYINRIKELENEIEKYKNYCLLPGEKLITIKFISTDQSINFNTFVKKSDNFTKLESSLYEYYPRYKDSENFFLVNGMKVNKHRTLEENKIKDNDILTLKDFSELI